MGEKVVNQLTFVMRPRSAGGTKYDGTSARCGCTLLVSALSCFNAYKREETNYRSQDTMTLLDSSSDTLLSPFV